MSTDAINHFVAHVTDTRFEQIPASAIDAAKRFTLDSFGVGIAGAMDENAGRIAKLYGGTQGEARVLGRTGVRFAAPHAALLNACQIHNSEYDCVHEEAVVHAMAVLLGALLAHIDRREEPVSGDTLLRAIVLGVDVAAGLGLAARTGLRFFRPGTAGAFGAVAGISAIEELDASTLRHAFGLAYAQVCGTMQAHSEGLALLAVQVGMNARNAIEAVDLARAGIESTRNTLEGPFGYFRLIEGDYDFAPVLGGFGSRFLIEEVAYKPYPSGRATHGILDAVLTMQREHRFDAADVASVRADVPPLTHRLVGRPLREAMTPSYARLCGAWVTARALMRGGLGVYDFDRAALDDPSTRALAGRVVIEANDNVDPNALSPLDVCVTLTNGARHERRLEIIYGHPKRPMTPEAALAKFRDNWSFAGLPEGGIAQVAQLVDALDQVTDVRPLIDLCAPA